MAESGSSDSSSSIFSLNTVLTVVTLVGGIILVSHKLASDRPAKPASEGTRPLGLQNIESRLWEDPFAAWDKIPPEQRIERAAEGFTNLVEALTNGLPSLEASNRLVLCVMISGQPYAEDRESRIRARFAIGAALGAGGYKPSEAEHIGLAACGWPDSKELERWKGNTNAELGINWKTCTKNNSNFCAAQHEELRLRVPFEQYESREFFPSQEYSGTQGITQHFSKIFLLWLDEDYFDDEPAARLGLFLKEIDRLTLTNGATERAIIGPRYSSTLRSLLSNPHLPSSTQSLWLEVTNTLRSARLILATPTAMDGVLMSSSSVSAADGAKPRQAIAQALGNGKVFESVTNFACTDDQLATEALQELYLRGIDPATNKIQHLILISEWDSFFSRVAGLAFAGELSARAGSNRSSLEFLSQVRGRTNPWPPRLHRYLYLRGLDGEAAESDGANDRRNKDTADRLRPASLDEIRKWTPDANKAEGPAQFDYLARLGDKIAALDRDLWRQQHSRVTSVGIIGSDVYDTLLILQALRERLPDAVFFTSDLDARFWDPRELRWTRNLLVFSGYGLQLSSQIQAGIAPFRESAQCAEFLATLCAIRNEKIQNLEQVPPRRFEIGRHGPVDLSFVDGAWVQPNSRCPPGSIWLPLVLVLGIPVVSGLLFWKPLRKLAWPSVDYCGEPLALAVEDFGGLAEVRSLLGKLDHRRRAGDPLAVWLPDPLITVPLTFSVGDFKDPRAFVARLKLLHFPVSAFLRTKLSPRTLEALIGHNQSASLSSTLGAALAEDIQRILKGNCIFEAARFTDVELRAETKQLLARNATGPNLIRLNRMLLEDAFPQEIIGQAAQQRIERRLRALMTKCNSLIFMKEPETLPSAEAVEKTEFLTEDLRRGLLNNLKKARDQESLCPSDLRLNRQVVNLILEKLSPQEPGKVTAGYYGWQASLRAHDSRTWRPLLFWSTSLVLGSLLLVGIHLAWRDTYRVPGGEPFNFVGTSTWPAEFIRFGVLALSVIVLIKTQRKLTRGFLDITRRYRLNLESSPPTGRVWLFLPPEPLMPETEVDANQLWSDYRRARHYLARSLRVLACVTVYFFFAWALMLLAGQPSSPLRGKTLGHLDFPLLLGAVFAFLFVTFWMIDTALLCAWFIRRLSKASTRYPDATLEHFSDQRAIDDTAMVEEWIDLQLIADLTEPIGRLVYWPFIAVLLLLVARNPWWDHWTWHWPLLVIFGINLVLAGSSSIILQRAALKARELGVQNLKTRVNQKQRKATSAAQHESNQAEMLLAEINNLRRGAFAPISKNPLVGALLVNSSGVVLVEILATIFSK